MNQLNIDLIRQDGGTQMRASISDATVDSYASDMEAGHAFPAVTVFHDGKTYWLADGFHRIAARNLVASKHAGTDIQKEWSVIDADIHAGTRHDAIKWAIGANKKNGLRRTNADKQIAVRAALDHPAMQSMSDQAIADVAGVSQPMVSAMRRQFKSVLNSSPNQANHKAANTATDRWAKTIGVDGKKYPPGRSAAKQTQPKRSTGVEREVQRVEHSEQRASATPNQRHVCPTCNGKGFIE